MIFTLVTAVQEKLNEIVDQIKSRREEEKERNERKEREAEEAEKVCCEHVPSECSVTLIMKSKSIFYNYPQDIDCFELLHEIQQTGQSQFHTFSEPFENWPWKDCFIRLLLYNERFVIYILLSITFV